MVNLTMSFLNGKTGIIDEMDVIDCLSKTYSKWQIYRNGHMPIEFLEENLTEQVEHGYKWCTALKILMDNLFLRTIEIGRNIREYLPQNPSSGSILEIIIKRIRPRTYEQVLSLVRE